jgi:prophage regulatory protein
MLTERFLREGEVARITGLGRSTRYALEGRGLFPRRRHITGKSVGWLESEILEWIQTRDIGRSPDDRGNSTTARSRHG